MPSRIAPSSSATGSHRNTAHAARIHYRIYALLFVALGGL
jgi:hypothetical protein